MGAVDKAIKWFSGLDAPDQRKQAEYWNDLPRLMKDLYNNNFNILIKQKTIIASSVAAVAAAVALSQGKNKRGRPPGSKNKTPRSKKSNIGDNVIPSIISPGFNNDNNNNLMTTGTPVSTRHSLTGTSSSTITDTPNTNINFNTSTSISISTSTSTNTSSNTNTSSMSTSNTSTNTGNAAIASTSTGTQTETITRTELPPLYCWVLDGGSQSSFAKFIDQSFLQWLLVSTTGDDLLSPNRIAIQWTSNGKNTDIPVTSIVRFDKNNNGQKTKTDATRRSSRHRIETLKGRENNINNNNNNNNTATLAATAATSSAAAITTLSSSSSSSIAAAAALATASTTTSTTATTETASASASTSTTAATTVTAVTYYPFHQSVAKYVVPVDCLAK